MHNDQPDLESLFTEHQPEELTDYLFVPSNRLLLRGSTVPAIASTEVVHASGLVIPSSARPVQPIDLVGTYVTASDYLPTPPDEFLPELIRQYVAGAPFREVVTSLVVANHWASGESQDDIATAYLLVLQPTPHARLTAALGSDHPRRLLLARQVALRAVRYTIEAAESDPTDDSFEWTQTLIVNHLVAETLGRGEDDTDETYGSYGSEIALEIARNELFNRSEDPVHLISRTRLLWEETVSAGNHDLRDTPANLLLEATGLLPTEWLAFGFGVYAHRTSNPPPGPIWMPNSYFSQADQDKRSAFFGHMSATRDELGARFNGQDDRWGFLPFEANPLLRDGNDYLLVDMQMLLDRVTTGLYWFVFDHEQSIDSEYRKAWTRAFGRMFETYAVGIAERIAPPLLNGDSTFYPENHLLDVADTKTCDCAIDFGVGLVLIEVVGGRLTVKSRIEGDAEALAQETKQLVYEKAEQLDEIIKTLIRDESALTGCPAPPGRRYYPVVVNIGSYPVNPITISVIEDHVREEGLFDDARVVPLSIIDIGEMEIVEGLAESAGSTLPEILDSWHESDLHRVSLRNHLFTTTSGNRAEMFRSRSLVQAWEAVTQDFLEILAPEEAGQAHREPAPDEPDDQAGPGSPPLAQNT